MGVGQHSSLKMAMHIAVNVKLKSVRQMIRCALSSMRLDQRKLVSPWILSEANLLISLDKFAILKARVRRRNKSKVLDLV